MGDVIVIYKITPRDSDIDVKALKTQVAGLIPKAAVIQYFEIVPLGYGVEMIKLNFKISDKVGGIDEFQDGVAKLPEVGSIETEDIGLA